MIHPNCTGTEVSALRTLPDLALCISSFGYSSISFIMSFNKLVNIPVSLSSLGYSRQLLEFEDLVMGNSDL